MKVIVCKNYDEMSAKAYEVMKEVLSSKDNAILGLATGSTPIGLYKEMIKDYKAGNVSYKNVSSVNLDEYIGQGVGDEQSYVEFMRNNLFNHVDIDLAKTDLPCGKAEDMQAECDRYNAKLASISVDIQVLGIGGNGHIGFNEPGTPFGSVTHVVDLTERTISDNARFFNSIEEVPTQAISMGIKNVMNAKKILLLASGTNKADAIYATVKGEVTETVPASILQLHPDCYIIVDEAAASKL
ncbi:MAG: glucosamine-6-phosphate deaminase [Clostridia bacterium]|nr:glucosamine-6-phosphate deaminase [Clostridia bacterium]